MRILLTAFESIPRSSNASREVMRALAKDPPAAIAADLSYELMPSDTQALEAAILSAIEKHRPEVCVFTGQAPRRNRITFERFATNWREFNTPDGAGNLISGSPIIPAAPAAYRSVLFESPRFIAALADQSIPAAMSNHAGNHLCNQLLYLGLHHCSGKQPIVPVGFIHVPVLPEQVLHEYPDSPYLPLSISREAIAIVLSELSLANGLPATSGC